MLIAVAIGLLAAGCGGGGGGGGTTETSASGQTVTGTGFGFLAPEGWTVKVQPTTAEAKQDASTLVSVAVLPLVKAYRPALFPRVVTELDRVATQLAGRTGGKVTARRTVRIAGRQARAYDIRHGDLVDRITFLLRGKRNYQLTCRWAAKDGEPAACDLLSSSFSFR